MELRTNATKETWSVPHVLQGQGPDGNNHEGMVTNSPWGMDHRSTNGQADGGGAHSFLSK